MKNDDAAAAAERKPCIIRTHTAGLLRHEWRERGAEKQGNNGERNEGGDGVPDLWSTYTTAEEKEGRANGERFVAGGGSY